MTTSTKTGDRRRDAVVLAGVACLLAGLYLIWLPLALIAAAVLLFAYAAGAR